MSDDLATAAVFGDQTQAVAARLHLEAAGMPAFLADETVAGGIFLWATAVGGIKLQVPKSRLEEALQLLDERMPGESAATDWSDVDVGRPEEEPTTEEPPEAPPGHHPEIVNSAVASELNVREQRVEGLFRAWWWGLFFFPVMFFIWWQLARIAIPSEPLRPEQRRKAQIAAVCILFSTALWLLALLRIAAWPWY